MPQGDEYCWLTSNAKGRGQPPPSPLGLTVGRICNVAFGGIYNMPRVHNVDWSNPRIITAKLCRDLATYDSDQLTALVVLCHDAAIRLEIAPSKLKCRDPENPSREPYIVSCLKLMFTQRTREGDIFSRHPGIEEAVGRVRSGLSSDFPRLPEANR